MTNQPVNLQENQNTSESTALQAKFNSARTNLLSVAAFTLINLILLVANSYSYFLFSASIPYILVDNAKYLCGMYPEDYYDFDYASAWFFPRSVFWIVLAVAVLIIAFYLLCFFLSKKNKVGWLIAALVFFAIDTVVMFLYYGFMIEMVMDILFHVWVIVILVMGIHAHFKRKKLPPVQLAPMQADGEAGDALDGEQAEETERTEAVELAEDAEQTEDAVPTEDAEQTADAEQAETE